MAARQGEALPVRFRCMSRTQPLCGSKEPFLPQRPRSTEKHAKGHLDTLHQPGVDNKDVDSDHRLITVRIQNFAGTSLAGSKKSPPTRRQICKDYSDDDWYE
ncbi:hypothetical protein NDU88_002877 [Pleurodeles waltl]|uniref:Uncharacterized protein n=1 Tax=Pleurodeles waltl TaxID=8319 RepID=A0AAV7W3E4_PLEWA|nr:hypothetical protein NDU88_002877 [Pleurodeles waltl]